MVRSPHTGLNPLRLGAERGEDDRRERVGFPGAYGRLGQLTLLFDLVETRKRGVGRTARRERPDQLTSIGDSDPVGAHGGGQGRWAS